MASSLLLNYGSSVTWQDSGGTETFTLANLSNGSGRNGAIHDWGAAPRSGLYLLEVVCQFQATPTVGNVLSVFIRTAGISGSAADPTNDDGTGDVALSATDKLLNLDPVAAVRVDEAAANIVTANRTTFFEPSRHFGPVVLNRAGSALKNTSNANFIRITPYFYEAQ